jgi:hypothetical protein
MPNNTITPYSEKAALSHLPEVVIRELSLKSLDRFHFLIKEASAISKAIGQLKKKSIVYFVKIPECHPASGIRFFRPPTRLPRCLMQPLL